MVRKFHHRLIGFAILLTVGVTMLRDNAAPAAITLEQLVQQREIATHRQRKLIYNNDGDDVLINDNHTPAGLLSTRTIGIAGTQVDSIFYNTVRGGFSQFSHNTQAGQVFTSTGGTFYNNMTQDLINQGTDALQVMVDYAHSNDIEIFWSMRMNDTHDAGGSFIDYAFPQLKVDHPEWLMGTSTNKPPYGVWSAVDYGVQEIRDLTLAYFTEVCQNYDIDGIELDFFRHPFFFRSHTSGGTATATDRAQMTQLLRDIRSMTEQVGMQREKPILMSVRVPDSTEMASAIGLDITQWLQEDLVDTMTVSGYYRANHWENSVALGHQYDVPVYASLDESRLEGDAGARKSLESYWARASGAWQEGVDGIYMFNYFNPNSELWNVVGSPETLAAKYKIYTTGARGVDGAYLTMNQTVVNGISYLNRNLVSPEHTVSLAHGQIRTFKISVGDDFSDPGIDGTVRVRLQMANLADVNNLEVRLNNQLISGGVQAGSYIDYQVDPSLVNKGGNDFVLSLKSTVWQTATIQDLQLWVAPTIVEPSQEVTLGLIDNGSPEPGLHSYTLTATGQGIVTLSEFTIDGAVHQVFHSGTPSEWLGDGSALDTDTTDSHVIFGQIRFPDMGGEPWPGPGGPPVKFTEEKILGDADAGMGTLNNFDETTGFHDAYTKLGSPSTEEETVELIQLIVMEGRGFTVDLKLLTYTDYDPQTGSSIRSHDLSYTLTGANMPGDANGDGFVDALDAAAMAQNWLKYGGWADGDFNNDGLVNDLDATLLAANWTGSPSANVPEPMMVTLLYGLVFGGIKKIISSFRKTVE